MGRRETRQAPSNGDRVRWLASQEARLVLRRKHALAILITLREMETVGTVAIIRTVHGHPAAVLRTLRDLERLGLVQREKLHTDRFRVQNRLTRRGLELVETPVHTWGPFLSMGGP